MSASDTQLEISNLSAWYGQAQALWDVTLRVKDGEVVGVLGRNGAGKTTLLRSIARLQRSIAGRISVGGRDITSLAPASVARAGVSFVREGAQLPGSLTVADNIRMGMRLARLRGREPRSMDEALERFPILRDIEHLRVVNLSGGQRQTAALVAAFVSNPCLLLLDEPSAGLAPIIAESVFETIAALARSGLALLVVEQTPAWLVGRAERTYLVDVGHVVAEGPIDEIASKIELGLI